MKPSTRRSPFTWSHLPPRSTGRYWYREDSEIDNPADYDILRIYKAKGENELSVRHGPGPDDVDYLANYHGQWAGPIPTPNEPPEDTLDLTKPEGV
jgi:hypothetical protein